MKKQNLNHHVLSSINDVHIIKDHECKSNNNLEFRTEYHG
jgi:hypothetical protein